MTHYTSSCVGRKSDEASAKRKSYKKNVRDVHGIFLLDKPIGVSSNLALQKVKRAFCARKAGHTGSLDPLASGLLPICLGELTKLSQYLLMADKQYQVGIRLGVRTDSGDCKGNVIEKHNAQGIDLARIEAELDVFRAGYLQVPPMYSAIKQQGKPLYLLARQGIEVERQPRPVEFSHIIVTGYYGSYVQLDVRCSKGTYVRSLADDLGQALGCGAHVVVLRRTGVGPFRSHSMMTLPGLQAWAVQGDDARMSAQLFAADSLFSHLPALELSDRDIERLRIGQRLPYFTDSSLPNGLLRLQNQQQRLVGLGTMLPDGQLKVVRMLQQVA